MLLASDREATLTRIKADVSALGCEVLVANHQVHHSSLDEAAKERWTPYPLPASAVLSTALLEEGAGGRQG